MNLRFLRYFVTLAREGHHGRAAALCNVTQPTLSGAIKHLEAELGVPLVERGSQRFRRLTVEGEAVLGWAQRMLADQDAMEQHLAEMQHGLTGRLRLGVVPAAIAVTPLLVTPFCGRHPRVTVEVASMTSAEIQRGLDAFELEAGLTYLDNEPLRQVRSVPLYQERYALLTGQCDLFADRAQISWSEAAKAPLCLLSASMQNRRIIDGLIERAGAPPARPRLEATSMLALCAHVRQGPWASIVPSSVVMALGAGLRAIPLDGPDHAYTVGVVASDRDPPSPLTRVFLADAAATDLGPMLRPG